MEDALESWDLPGWTDGAVERAHGVETPCCSSAR